MKGGKHINSDSCATYTLISKRRKLLSAPAMHKISGSFLSVRIGNQSSSNTRVPGDWGCNSELAKGSGESWKIHVYLYHDQRKKPSQRGEVLVSLIKLEIICFPCFWLQNEMTNRIRDSLYLKSKSSAFFKKKSYGHLGMAQSKYVGK